MPPVREGKVLKPRPDSKTWSYRLPRDAQGRRKQIGGFKTKREALDALAIEMAKIRSGKAYRPQLTFAQLVDDFFAKYRASERTRRTLREWLVEARNAFDPILIDRLDAATIEGWLAALPREKYREKQLRALKQVLNYAVRAELLDRSPAVDIHNIAAPREEVVTFESWADVEAVGAALPERFRAIPVFATGTGLRPTEWVALKVGDVDLREQAVTVRRRYTDGVWTDAPTRGKGARRRVPLRTRVIDALRESSLLGPGVDPDALLFPAAEGGPINLNNWRRREWFNALIDAGFVEGEGGEARVTRHPYAMRHTYATWALAAGVSVYALSRRMGTSLKMIDVTYGHLARDADDHERGLLDAYDAKLDADDRARETAAG